MHKTVAVEGYSRVAGTIVAMARASVLLMTVPVLAQSATFTPGNLVVVVEGCGVYAGTCTNVPNGTGTGTGNSSVGGYGDNQAAPLTLFQFAPGGTSSATFVNALVLPQAASGANLPVSGEYGSSSEGTVQLSGNGYYLTVMGYGIDVASFDANPANYGAAPSLALAQSGSLTGQSYTPVPRVLALVDAYGRVNSSTALYNVFNTNNPRSAYTLDGTGSFYVSGQGSGTDATGGVFLSPIGGVNNAPTAITGLDASGGTVAQDTRMVQVVNGTLYFSVDSKAGSGNSRDFIGVLGTAGTLPTTTVGAPAAGLIGNSGGTGKVTITSGTTNTGNGLNAGVQVNISPSNFYFANAATLYVADAGIPKNNSTVTSGTSIGDGGLQKWVNSAANGSGTWSLAYTLYKGLSLVANTSAAGATGLYGLAGTVVGGTVQLYATNYNINDLDPTYLYGVSDTLSYTTPAQAASETFSKLATAPSDSNFKGVSFAPTAAPKATPAVSWASPAAITYGSALTSDQLNATASVPGTFAYTPAVGTVLPAGAGQALSVVFTPTDTTDYTTASGSTTITINAATPVTPASLLVTRLLTRTATNVTVQVTVANTGGTAAANVTLTSVKVGSATAVVLPQSLGTIAPGSSAVATVTVPLSAGASGAASSLTVAGTYTAGTFSSSARITLP